MNADAVIRALGALAQEHRLAAYRLLVQAGPEGLAAGAVAQGLGVPASSMSFHLAQLANAGHVPALHLAEGFEEALFLLHQCGRAQLAGGAGLLETQRVAVTASQTFQPV